MKNLAFRERAKKYGVPLWMVAEEIGVHANTFSAWLRHELPEERRKQVEAALDAVIAARG